MAHVLIHTRAIDDLAASRRGLPRELVNAFERHPEYGRFGAVLPNLPRFAPMPRDLVARARGRVPAPPVFTTLMHNAAPVEVGLRLAELVAEASLVGRSAGVAVVAGWFSHVALDRSLCPPVQDIVRRLRLPDTHPRDASQLVEQAQALLYLQAREGRPIAGWSGVTEALRILRRPGFPVRGIGRGLHLLIHHACADTVGPAPAKRDMDRWVKGFYVYARWLASPLAARQALPDDVRAMRETLYQGPDFDFEAAYRAALERVRHHVVRAMAYLSEGDFSRAARTAFFEDVPEGALK